MLKIDQFDSQIIGLPVGKIYISDPLTPSSDIYKLCSASWDDLEAKIIFCTTNPAPINIHYLMKFGFRFISASSLYEFSQCSNLSYKLPERCSIKENGVVSSFISESFTELAKLLGGVSHYGKDYLLGVDVAEKIFMQWLINSFNGYAEKIFTVMCDEQLGGLVSLREKDGDLYIDLLGVRAAYSGMGLGNALVKEAIKYARVKNKKLFVWTQVENITASRLYQQNGFLTNRVNFVFHKTKNIETLL